MHLQRLDIQGFKSFAKKTTLLFPKSTRGGQGITVIVGPNGSGKSNVVDALRWVLGEQSLKTIRTKKSEDILFAGSHKRAPVGIAEVSITLENADLAMPVAWREVTITRRAYRDGENEYFMNKTPMRHQDIVLLLAQGQFGQKTYSVIGQGMADAILNATPFERKEFFDDAAGVKQYTIKKEQALRKLEASRENLAQASVVRDELEPRYKSLNRQVKKLERREELLQELRELQAKYFSSLWAAAETTKSTARTMLEKATHKVALQETILRDLKAAMEAKAHEQQSTQTPETHINELLHIHAILMSIAENNPTIPAEELQKHLKPFLATLHALRDTLTKGEKAPKAPFEEFLALQDRYLKEDAVLRELLAAQQEASVAVARAETQHDELHRTILQDMNIEPTSLQSEGSTRSLQEQEALRHEITRLKDTMGIIGSLDPEIVKEFEATKERFEFLDAQCKDLENAITSTQKIITELDTQIALLFEQAFEDIATHFAQFFKELFQGGSARLELIKETKKESTPSPESEDSALSPTTHNPTPETERIGIEIHACPPGKRVKNIASLSGGERALTSLALLYAILAHRAPPFVVLDEVDAALDEANSRKSLKILRELSNRVQCIMISHNRTTMEEGDTLYGVTLGEDGTSLLLSLNLAELGQEQISALAHTVTDKVESLPHRI